MATFSRAAVLLSIVLIGTVIVSGQQPPAPAAAPPPEPSEAGIPIPDKTVQAACSPCHRPDADGIMSRISFRRTTPEGWEVTVRRMASLNGMKIEPATARQVLRYLSNHLGLAPEEAKTAAFESERRMIDFTYAASRDAEEVCTKCHSIGRVLLQRRTKEEWGLLVDMHRGWYPLSDFQAFRRGGPPSREPGPDGRPPDNRHPYEKALEHLTSAFPLHTPEWAVWSATMRAPKLEGTWSVSAHETGKGPLYGRMVVTPGTSPEEFNTDMTLTYARSGETVTRKGRGIVYTGHQWRGRSTALTAGRPTESGEDATSLREVMTVDREWQSIEGRWYSGGYDELGIDVHLRRAAGGQPALLGTSRTTLRRGTTAQEVRLFGTNLPPNLSARDLDFGQGVTVTRVANAAPDQAVVTLDVAATAPFGVRDVVLGGTVKPAALAVVDRVDYIRIAPEWAMARLGGVAFPKGLARFEAVGFHNGRDGKPDTKDDIALGIVDAKWSLEEYSAVLNDEDLKYVGTIDAATGVFTPNVEGPNPNRRGSANNVGDVWVIATYTDTAAKSPRPLRARAHLLVTVPLYMRWETSTEPTQ
jgi:quinohemoprotein amine dehydrogenase